MQKVMKSSKAILYQFPLKKMDLEECQSQVSANNTKKIVIVPELDLVTRIE
jgi:hypothetical protein